MMAAYDVFIAAYCRLIAAETKQFYYINCRFKTDKYGQFFGAENYIFWQPMAARLYISLW